MDISEEDYQKAVGVVRKCLSGSVSNLQRKLYWGYGRAASAIDRMQDEFIVSPMAASGRRDVYPEETHQLWKELQSAKAQAVPEESKRQGGYYIRDLRNQPGNCMKFWYQGGYGTKHKNFFWCETLEQAKKYQGGCGWFEIWHAPYIDSLVEHTVDFQLADRSIGFVDLEAQEQKG